MVKTEKNELKRILEEIGSPVILKSPIALKNAFLENLKKTLSKIAGKKIEIKIEIERGLTGAILYLGKERKIELDIRRLWADELEEKLKELEHQQFLQAEEISAHIKEIIKQTEPAIKVEEAEEIGKVLQVGDGIARVSGLKSVGANELVRFAGDVYGLAFNLETEAVGCILLGPEEVVREGSAVKRTGHILQVPVGDELIGRIVNALGQPIDGKSPIKATKFRPVERIAPGVIYRQPVKEPLQTGIKAIDALIPIGRGQRELIIGDRKIGKTAIVVDTILNQKEENIVCIYAAIGQKASTIARVVHILDERGAMDYTIIVAALPNEQTAFRYLVPYTACALGEEFMEQGKHALVIYDDLSKHALAYREMSALLKRPIGREAYPGDIFYCHSRLLERAAKLRDDLGGGSLTALPIVETLGGDVTAYISTNVISITDGQLYLESELFNTGFRPAINVGLSVSRVGSAAQNRAMKKVAGKLRIDLAQYHEMAAFVKFGAELDAATKAQLARGERGRALLIQPQYSPMSVEDEVAVLYAVVNGYLDDVPVEKVGIFETQFLKFLKERYSGILIDIKKTADLRLETEERLKSAILEFKKEFK